jgi:hypothetical protein
MRLVNEKEVIGGWPGMIRVKGGESYIWFGEERGLVSLIIRKIKDLFNFLCFVFYQIYYQLCK